MPTETAIIVAGIVLMFSSLIIALAWADYYTRNTRTPGASYF
jgi:hypothetical protein